MLDDLLDELNGKVYVVVNFDVDMKKIRTISERMTKDDAVEFWRNTRYSTDWVAHYLDPHTEIYIAD